MASKEIAKMLDEMMGAHRNSNPDDRDKERLTWWARGVCPYYLVDYCPHDLFTNTKGDLGACPKIHNDALKRDFADAQDTEPKKAEMMDDFLRFAQRLVGDLQSKIRRGKERATISQMERDAQNGISPQQQEEIEAKVTILTEKINELVTQAESAGTGGDIEEAQGLLKLCDTLKGEREDLKNQIGMKQHKLPPGFGGDGRHGENRQMEVCEVCGAFVNFWVGAGGENQSRVDDHLMGKQHIGYARLRATVESLGNEVQRLKDLLEEKEAENGKKETVFERNARLATTPRAIEGGKDENSENKKSRSRSKEKSEKEKSSSRRRSRSRSKGSRRRSRSSERRSKRDRSRSRDRRRGRDRSRERKRSRSRDRKSSRERRRERSRERRRGGRSRSRSRS